MQHHPAIVLDHELFEETRQMSGSRFCMLLGYFLEDTARLLPEITEAMDTHAWDDAARLAHTLKSSALQFGFITVGHPARVLEVACVAYDRGNAAPVEPETLLKPLQQALESLQPHLRNYIEKIKA